MPRFDYMTAKSRAKIEALLDDCFASGDICEGERPCIEERRDYRGRLKGYALTLPR